MQRWDVINALLGRFPGGGSYLEIGSQRRDCFKMVRAGNKEDIEPYPIGGRRPSYPMLSDDFFEKVAPTLLRKWDVIFIDGLHLCNQALKDVWNCSKFLAPNGYIILHDCRPDNEEAQQRIQGDGAWMGDVWKALVWLVDKFPNVWTIAEDCGLGVIRGPLTFDLPPVEELLKYEWKDFSEDKIRLRLWEDSLEML
jgi:hypothetical protein